MRPAGGKEGPSAGEAFAVACTSLSKTFGSVVAVEDVSLEVPFGEVLALLGPSGCGKTTFLRLIAGFERPDAGTIGLAGVTVQSDVVSVPPERRRVGFVFQDYALFPHLTVGGNIGFGVDDRAARRARIAEMLELVGLEGLEDRYPHELSGGQQQRVALARALARAPSIVLLDEPFSNLDADLRERVRADVRGILARAKATAIFVTHDQDEAFAIADRVAVMRRGRIEQIASAEDIYSDPATRFVAGFVGQAHVIAADVRGGVAFTEIGGVPVANVPDGAAEVMVRPEDVRLERDDTSDAQVVSRRFLGPVTITVVTLASGASVSSAHAPGDRYSPGDRVRVTFAPERVVLFRGERRLS